MTDRPTDDRLVYGMDESLTDEGPDVHHDRPTDDIAIDLPSVLQAHAGWLRDTDVSPPRERLVHDLLRAATRIVELEAEVEKYRLWRKGRSDVIADRDHLRARIRGLEAAINDHRKWHYSDEGCQPYPNDERLWSVLDD